MKFSLTYTAAAIFLAKGALGEDVTTVTSTTGTTSSSSSFTTQSTSTTGTWTTTGTTSSSSSTSTNVEGDEAEFPGCRDVANWASSDDENCQNYRNREYCTLDGNIGAGWDTTWGNLAEYTDGNGVNAFVACCACGGGMEEETAEITEAPQPDPAVVSGDPAVVSGDPAVDVDEETTQETTEEPTEETTEEPTEETTEEPTEETTSTFEETTSTFEETTSTGESTSTSTDFTSTSTGESTSTSTGESTSTSTGESTSTSTGESTSTAVAEDMPDKAEPSTSSSSSSSTTSSTSTSTGSTSTDVLEDNVVRPHNSKKLQEAKTDYDEVSSTSTSTAAETTSSTDNAVEGDKEDGIIFQATDSASTVQSGLVLATACIIAALAMVV